MANPPSRGIGWEWIFLPPGRSMAPKLLAIDLTHGVSRNEVPRAATKTMTYFNIYGFSGLFGLSGWV